jgi:hypothetical protein
VVFPLVLLVLLVLIACRQIDLVPLRQLLKASSLAKPRNSPLILK